MRDHYLANSLLVVVSLLSAGCNTGYTKSNGKWTYIIINEAVGREVRAIDADVTTFKVHPNPAYASDKNHVYRYGLVLEGFDGATYRQLPDGEYSIDANGVYWWDSLIEAADPNSFRVLKGPYSRDDKHVFCGTLRMNVEDPINSK